MSRSVRGARYVLIQVIPGQTTARKCWWSFMTTALLAPKTNARSAAKDLVPSKSSQTSVAKDRPKRRSIQLPAPRGVSTPDDPHSLGVLLYRRCIHERAYWLEVRRRLPRRHRHDLCVLPGP